VTRRILLTLALKGEANMDNKGPTWLTVITAFFSLASALGVAFVNFQVEKVRQQAETAKTEVEKLALNIKEQEVGLEQRRLEADQQTRREKVVIEHVPKILSVDENDKRAAIAIFFVLYPNEAKDILARIQEALGGEQQSALAPSIQQAKNLDIQTGFWAVVVSSDSTLEGAQFEVNRAKQQGYTPVMIYKRGPWFATTVGNFPSRGAAEGALIPLRAKIRDSAFIANLPSWCPNPAEKAGYYACQG
jgi:hypothetical protein